MSDRPQNKNLKPFKKGQSGNPSGKPKTPPDVLEAKKTTNADFVRIASQFLGMTRQEVSQALNKPEASMLELLIGGIVAKAAKDHDYLRANFILDRTIGKVPDTINNNHGFKSLHMQLVEIMEKAKVNE